MIKDLTSVLCDPQHNGYEGPRYTTKKVISWTIHYFEVGIVVSVTESLLAYNTIHRAKLGEVVRVGVCLAVVVLLLEAP